MEWRVDQKRLWRMQHLGFHEGCDRQKRVGELPKKVWAITQSQENPLFLSKANNSV